MEHSLYQRYLEFLCAASIEAFWQVSGGELGRLRREEQSIHLPGPASSGHKSAYLAVIALVVAVSARAWQRVVAGCSGRVSHSQIERALVLARIEAWELAEARAFELSNP